jgi:hypothetical protein
MNGVDLSRFEFDYDTTWSAFFLTPDLDVYSRYGGRDAQSADSRHSKESLLQTMGEVLEVHERRKRNPDPRDLHPPPSRRTTPEQIPLLAANHRGCVHCHQIQEYRLLQAFQDGVFSNAQLFGFPLPENLGIRFQREHGHKVSSVAAGSAAATAGLQPGDIVTRVNDVPVRSEYDLRWALHRADDRRPLSIRVARSGPNADAPARTVEIEVALAGDWRQTELAWRKSLRSVPLAIGFLGYALDADDRSTLSLTADRMAIRVISIRGAGLAESAGLRKGDTIVALDGNRAHRTLDQLKSDLLRKYAPGDRVRLRVLREGTEIDLEGPFPPWHIDHTSVP